MSFPAQDAKGGACRGEADAGQITLPAVEDKPESGPFYFGSRTHADWRMGTGLCTRCLCVGFLVANKVMLKNMGMMRRTEVIMNPHFYKAAGNCALK